MQSSSPGSWALTHQDLNSQGQADRQQRSQLILQVRQLQALKLRGEKTWPLALHLVPTTSPTEEACWEMRDAHSISEEKPH